MLYVTGDLHGEDLNRFSSNNFPEQDKMSKEDYLLICGDFGLIWDWRGESHYEHFWLNWLENKPFTTLFIDGNHECHPRLNAYPIEQWHGGNVHKISSSVIHLMRGQVFEIDGQRIFTFGGARSHDIRDGVFEPEDPKIKLWKNDLTKLFRVNHRSWWKEEFPSEEELQEGIKNLEKVNWDVDYIFTHEMAASTLALYSHGFYKPDSFSQYLEEIRYKIPNYTRWICGHYHENKCVTNKDWVIYEQITRILEKDYERGASFADENDRSDP